MRLRLTVLSASVLLLLVAAPASAQRASLAERVASLEQQAAASQGNTALVNEITQLRSEVQAQRAQLEELQHQLDELNKRNRAQYIDLDSRLARLEGGAPALPAPPGATAGTSADDAAAAATQPAATPAPADAPPAVYGDPGSLARGADERGAYDNAFAALRDGQYDESARRFQAFLQQFPSGTYAPNALYWLGESYYVTQNYALAQQQFQSLLDRYPTHDKAPGALLKVGLSQYGQRQYDAAQATLQQVVDRYPGTDAARTAQDRLRAIQLAKTQ
ncbi:MAG TPA: tol-pal system protein YbgF [Xanthomonadaceae bacterium]|nr:tol-pal system protein YbgF [Xanthomonadaceae bacterium]